MKDNHYIYTCLEGTYIIHSATLTKATKLIKESIEDWNAKNKDWQRSEAKELYNTKGNREDEIGIEPTST